MLPECTERVRPRESLDKLAAIGRLDDEERKAETCVAMLYLFLYKSSYFLNDIDATPTPLHQHLACRG